MVLHDPLPSEPPGPGVYALRSLNRLARTEPTHAASAYYDLLQSSLSRRAVLVVVEETGVYCQARTTTMYNHLWLFMCLSHLRPISDWSDLTWNNGIKKCSSMT